MLSLVILLFKWPLIWSCDASPTSCGSHLLSGAPGCSPLISALPAPALESATPQGAPGSVGGWSLKLRSDCHVLMWTRQAFLSPCSGDPEKTRTGNGLGPHRPGAGGRRWGESRNEPVMLPGPRSMGSTPALSRDTPGAIRRPHQGSTTPLGPTGVSGSDHPPSEGSGRSCHFTDEEYVQGRDGVSSQDASWELASSLGAGVQGPPAED